MSYLNYDSGAYAQFESTIRALGLTDAQVSVLVEACRAINESDEDWGEEGFWGWGSESGNYVDCPTCGGTGYDEFGHVCRDCAGTGKVMSGMRGKTDDEDLDDIRPETDSEIGETEGGLVDHDDTDSEQVAGPSAMDLNNAVARVNELAASYDSGSTWDAISSAIQDYAADHQMPDSFVNKILTRLPAVFMYDENGIATKILNGESGVHTDLRLDGLVDRNLVGEFAGWVVKEVAHVYHEISGVVAAYLDNCVRNSVDDMPQKLVCDKCMSELIKNIGASSRIAQLPSEPMRRLYLDETNGLCRALGKFMLGMSRDNPFAAPESGEQIFDGGRGRSVATARGADGKLHAVIHRNRTGSPDADFMRAISGGMPEPNTVVVQNAIRKAVKPTSRRSTREAALERLKALTPPGSGEE